MCDAVALQEELQRPADDQAVIAHRRNDEHLVERQRLCQETIEPNIGEDAAGKAEAAHLVTLDEPADRLADAPLQQRLDRGGGILTRLGASEGLKTFAQRLMVGKIHLDPGIFGHPEMALHLRQQCRLAERGEPGQLAFMARHLPAERLGDKAIGEPHAALGLLAAEPAIVAVKVCQHSVTEEVMAVRNLIAGAVGGVDQRIFPVGEEKRRQGVAEMVVREEHPRAGPQAEIGDKAGAVEHIERAAARILPEHDAHLAQLLPSGPAPQVLAQFFARPPVRVVAAQEKGA